MVRIGKCIVLFGAALLPLLAALPRPAAAASTTITVIGLSDYHSHAVPFYSEGAPNQAGVARTVAYLKAQRAANLNLLVLSGGDTMNKGTPTWSDEYHCAEWPWFNGLFDAMALGNHEFDYGEDVFAGCRASATYPVLSANYVAADGTPLLTASGKPYLVTDVGGVKVGMFALAGSDFAKLIRPVDMPAGATFADRVATARSVVATLRDTEHAQVVILFGHAQRDEDAALAQAVPGIDLILGTHSHYEGALELVPNTSTYIISPFQYLTYLSRVQLTVTDGKVTNVTGALVKMDAAQPQDPAIGAQVTQMQTDLEAKRPERFKVLGSAAVELSDRNISTDETVLGNWSMETVRAAAGTHAFFSTSSSFRAAIPPGPITVEGFFTAIPYKNSVVTADLTGAQLLDLLNLSVSKRNTDSFLQESGVRFKVQNGTATDVQVLSDPTNPAAGYAPLDPVKVYHIGVTNFMSGVAPGYKELLAGATNVVDTKRDIGTLLTDAIGTGVPISGALDGRMGTATEPAPVPGMPTTGHGFDAVWEVLALALALLIGGAALARRPARA
ncbi:MAG TPA: bifunctional UDP-sugar hydrolase/5'-nucleotidase [Chloroflexia bacterium]|nr:bifunctional UDP-sugar hydrolase/5'-nucleotidase [Chloroflexia bacterium]